jgi:shikimate kinase
MLIMIIGNMASGKTTLGLALQDSLPGYKFINIDDYRRKYNIFFTPEGEDNAQRHFIEDLRKIKNVIAECTGTGKWYPYYFCHDQHLTIMHKSNVSTCKKRHAERTKKGYQLPPIPRTWNMEFNSSLDWMHGHLKGIRNDIVINCKDSVKTKTKTIIKYLIKQKIITKS